VGRCFCSAPPAAVQGIDAFFGFQLPHGVGDPLLDVIAEPRLNTIRKPDGLAGEELGGRRPTCSAFEFSFTNPLQVFITNEQAQMPNSVKLQVAVDGSEGKLPAGESFIDHLHNLLQLLRIIRIELANRPQQLLDNYVVDLGRLLAFEGQVELPRDLQVRILVEGALLDKNYR
jgi:hypothetical protein